MSYRFMSDADISAQYDGFVVKHFSIEQLRFSDGWSGCLELEFPCADEVDFDSTKVDNFIVYDNEGLSTAFEHWYPSEVTRKLTELIRSEIRKRM